MLKAYLELCKYRFLAKGLVCVLGTSIQGNLTLLIFTTRLKDLLKTGAPFNSHDILFPKGGYQVDCAVMTINT